MFIMMTKMLLATVYWLIGCIFAILGSAALGFALGALIGVFNIFRYKWTWALILGYAAGSFLCLLLMRGNLFLALTFADHTSFEMYPMVLIGFILAGLFLLAFIPSFIKVAMRQTRGWPTE